MSECIPGASKEESSEGLEFGANGRRRSWRAQLALRVAELWHCSASPRAKRLGSQRFHRRAQQQQPDWPPGWWCYRQERLFCFCLHLSCSVSWLPVSACSSRPAAYEWKERPELTCAPARPLRWHCFSLCIFLSLAPSLRDHAAHAAEIQPRTRAKVGLGRAAREPKRLRGTTPPRRLDPTPIPPRPPMSGQHPRLWRRKAAFFGRPFAVNVQRCNGSSVAFFSRELVSRSRGGEVSRGGVWRDLVF